MTQLTIWISKQFHLVCHCMVLRRCGRKHLARPPVNHQRQSSTTLLSCFHWHTFSPFVHLWGGLDAYQAEVVPGGQWRMICCQYYKIAVYNYRYVIAPLNSLQNFLIFLFFWRRMPIALVLCRCPAMEGRHHALLHQQDKLSNDNHTLHTHL